MRVAGIVVLVIFAIGGCRDTGEHWWQTAFVPHECSPPYSVTPKGRMYCAHERQSVVQGYTTEAEIAAAIDSTLDAAEIEFAASYDSSVPIWLHDDYVYYLPNAYSDWAAGDTYGPGTRIRVALWSRGISYADPSPAFIVRGPDFCAPT